MLKISVGGEAMVVASIGRIWVEVYIVNENMTRLQMHTNIEYEIQKNIMYLLKQLPLDIRDTLKQNHESNPRAL